MQNEKFNELVAFVVNPIGDGLMRHYSGLCWRTNWEADLYLQYGEMRQSVRSKMQLAQDAHQRIDRHKIAATFANAILSIRPIIESSETKNPSAGHRLINEALAFLVGGAIVIKFIRNQYKNDEIKLGRIGKEIQFPPANEIAYPEHAYKALWHAKSSNTLDDFLLSNLFFMIESYHLKGKGIIDSQSVAADSFEAVGNL